MVAEVRRGVAVDCKVARAADLLEQEVRRGDAICVGADADGLDGDGAI